MKMTFTKMHGLGNDFIVVDTINQSISLDAETIAALACRHTGIGFDQCLLIEASQQPDIDFNYRIFNADGQEVGQCGNGARCMALYLHHYGLSSQSTVRVATASTHMRLLIDRDRYSVELPRPLFHPDDIPLRQTEEAVDYCMEVLNHPVHFHAVNLGNPHAVILVNDISNAAVDTLGQALSTHNCFPEQVNVGFMQMTNDNHLLLRVYERGCGETKACGSGAAAAAVVARRFYGFTDPVRVGLPGGELLVSWPDEQAPVLLTGPAVIVFEGVVTL